jgi:hypothetical protein
MRKTITTVLTLLLILFSLNIQIHGMIWANDSCRAYRDGCSTSGSVGDTLTYKKSDLTLGHLVIEGAGYFLKSNSDMQLFLNQIELSGLNGMDYKAVTEILNSAIENMERARILYENLIALAKVTPYNTEVITILINFDYTGFQIEYGLNTEIFKSVEELLNRGDVTGIYIHLKSCMDSMMPLLNRLKTFVDNEKFPEIEDVLELNQLYANALLFGQYVAQVFDRILE